MRAALAILTLLCAPLAWAAAPTRATLPTQGPDFNADGTADTSCTQPAAVDSTVCAAGCDYTTIQAAIDAVAAATIGPPLDADGYLITVDNAMAAETGQVTLKAHDGDGDANAGECEDFVWIVPDTHASLPAKGTRADAGDAANMFALDRAAVGGTGERAIFINNDARYWWIRGADITHSDASDGMSAMIQCERSGLNRPDNIVFEQVYAHAPASGLTNRAFFFDCDDSAVVDSTVTGLEDGSSDSQAILGYCGDGVLIENNFLSGASETIMLGGGDPGADCQSLDWTIRNNVVTKDQAWLKDRDGDLTNDDTDTDVDNDGTVNGSDSHFVSAWDGTNHAVKNLIEIKNGQRVLIEGNWFYNNDYPEQKGPTILLKPACQCSGSDVGGCERSTFGVRHITVRGNFGHTTVGGFRVTGDSTSTHTGCDLDGDGTNNNDSWETHHHPNGDHDNDGTVNSADAEHIALGTFNFPAGEFYTIEHNILVNLVAESTDGGSALLQGDKLDDLLFSHNTIEMAREYGRGINFNAEPAATNANCDWTDVNGDGTLNNFDEDCEPMDDSAVYDNIFFQRLPLDGDGDGTVNAEVVLRCEGSTGDSAISDCFTNSIATAFYNNVMYSQDGTLNSHSSVVAAPNYVARLDVDGDGTPEHTYTVERINFTDRTNATYAPLNFRLCQGAADPVAGCVAASPYAAGQAEDASDDTDVGANATAVDCFTAGVESGTPTGTWASCFGAAAASNPPTLRGITGMRGVTIR